MKQSAKLKRKNTNASLVHMKQSARRETQEDRVHMNRQRRLTQEKVHMNRQETSTYASARRQTQGEDISVSLIQVEHLYNE